MRGRFLLIDGPDGAGKGVFLDTMRREAEGKRILDLHTYWQAHGTHPGPDELAGVDLLLSSEPTFVGAGKRIREELIRKGSTASARTIAQAYAEDRALLYEQVLIPALKRGIDIIQSRGVTTSLVYQPLDAEQKGESLTVEAVASLPGNQACLTADALPDMILILTVSDPAELMHRLGKREKQDDSFFETKAFQERVLAAFTSDWFRNFFTTMGVTVRIIDTSTSIEASRAAARNIYHELFQ